MNFSQIAKERQSCRNYDSTKQVEQEKLDAILEAAILAPSACNGQPYHFTVCKDKLAKDVAAATMDMGKNKFADKAPVMIVISEMPYLEKAETYSKIMNNDYRSIDIGITTAYLTAAATEQGLSTCILGWFDDKKIRSLCSLENQVRIVITLGYAAQDDIIRDKKRKDISEIVTVK